MERTGLAVHPEFTGAAVAAGGGQTRHEGKSLAHRRLTGETVHMWGSKEPHSEGSYRKLRVSLCIFGVSELPCGFISTVIERFGIIH